MTFPVVCVGTGPFAYDLNVRILWSLVVDDVHQPLEAEIEGAVDLTDDYNWHGIFGWEVNTEIRTVSYYGPFSRQLPAGQSIDVAQLVFSGDVVGGASDIRSLIERDDEGYIWILPSGSYQDFPTAPMNVYPVRVAQITQLQQLKRGSSDILVSFAVTNQPGQNVVVSAS